MNNVHRLPVLDSADLPARPRTRGDCESVPRPCPFVSCRYNLYLDTAGPKLRIVRPNIEPDEMPAGASCALDVADRGGATLEEVGQYAAVVRERVRQIEASAFDRMRGSGNLGDFAETLGSEETGSPLAQLQSGNGGAGVSDEDPHLVAADDPDHRARALARRAYGRRLAANGTANVLADEDEDRGARASRLSAEAKSGAWNAEDDRELAAWLENDPWASRLAAKLDELAGAPCEAPRRFLAPVEGPAEVVESTVCEEPDSEGGAGSSQAAESKSETEASMGLTTRQQAIADAYNSGASPKAIASEFGTTAQTVHDTISRLRKHGGIITRERTRGPAPVETKPKPARNVSPRPLSTLSGFVVTREDPLLEQLRVRRAELVAAHEAKIAGIDTAIVALGGST